MKPLQVILAALYCNDRPVILTDLDALLPTTTPPAFLTTYIPFSATDSIVFCYQDAVVPHWQDRHVWSQQSAASLQASTFVYFLQPKCTYAHLQPSRYPAALPQHMQFPGAAPQQQHMQGHSRSCGARKNHSWVLWYRHHGSADGKCFGWVAV